MSVVGMEGKNGQMYKGRSSSTLCGREVGNKRKLQDFIKCYNFGNNTLSAGTENEAHRKMQKSLSR
jgi:hypothetical protein